MYKLDCRRFRIDLEKREVDEFHGFLEESVLVVFYFLFGFIDR